MIKEISFINYNNKIHLFSINYDVHLEKGNKVEYNGIIYRVMDKEFIFHENKIIYVLQGFGEGSSKC